MRIPVLTVVLASLIVGLACATPSPLTLGYTHKGARAVDIATQRKGGVWLEGEATARLAETGRPRGARDDWRLFTLTGQCALPRGGPIVSDETGSLIAPLTAAAPGEGVALRGGTPTQPRHGTSVTHPQVVDAVTRVLREHGTTVAKTRVVQCVKVDLDGDKHSEWLVCARSRDDIHHGDVPRKADDYSLALLLCEAPQGSLRVEALHVEATPAPEMSLSYRWVGVVDLDGDGRLEAALHTQHYEGGGLEIWSFDGKQASKTASGGWGL